MAASDAGGVVRRRLRAGESMSATIVAAVAEAAECSTADVQPLYTVLDPDTLDSLFDYGQGPSWEGRISFRLDEFTVTVHGTGEVVVRPRSGRPSG
jgi:hypothetical protein